MFFQIPLGSNQEFLGSFFLIHDFSINLCNHSLYFLNQQKDLVHRFHQVVLSIQKPDTAGHIPHEYSQQVLVEKGISSYYRT